MARFNPQAFLAGMQSLVAPQQQADQQVAQMRMQQMDRAREQENMLNQRMVQGQQMRIQQNEADRATERFGLERDAAARQKVIDKRNLDAAKLGTDKERTAAVAMLTEPVNVAKSKLLAARTKYNNAISRPSAYTRTDFTTIVNNLVEAQGNYKAAFDQQKGILKYVSPSFKLDESVLGTPEVDITPLTYNDAVKALKAAGVAAPAKKVEGEQTVPGGQSPKPIEYIPPTRPAGVKVGTLATDVEEPMQVASDKSQIDALSLLAPTSLGIGVNAPAGIGAVPPSKTVKPVAKPPVKLDKNGKPIPQKVAAPPPAMPVRPMRSRLFPDSEDAVLDSNDVKASSELQKGFMDFAISTFNVNPLNKDFKEIWHRHISNPDLMRQYLAPLMTSVKFASPESYQSVLADFEGSVLNSIGKQARVPVAMEQALLDVAVKRQNLTDAKSEAEYKSDLQPLTLEKLRAEVDYYKSGGRRAQAASPFKGVPQRVSMAQNFGKPEIVELDKIIKEYSDAINNAKVTQAERQKYTTDPAYKMYGQAQIVKEARSLKAKIMTQRTLLRASAGNEARFMGMIMNFDPIAGVKSQEILNRLYSLPEIDTMYDPSSSTSGASSRSPASNGVLDDPTFLLDQ
jgi:hypothetical protein